MTKTPGRSSKPPIKKGPKGARKMPSLAVPSDVKPQYSNMVRIAHLPAELIFDFALLLPGNSQARVVSQVLMSPISAKLFFKALGENLKKYENNFGEIVVPRTQSLADYLFRPPQPPDEPPES